MSFINRVFKFTKSLLKVALIVFILAVATVSIMLYRGAEAVGDKVQEVKFNVEHPENLNDDTVISPEEQAISENKAVISNVNYRVNDVKSRVAQLENMLRNLKDNLQGRLDMITSNFQSEIDDIRDRAFAAVKDVENNNAKTDQYQSRQIKAAQAKQAELDALIQQQKESIEAYNQQMQMNMDMGAEALTRMEEAFNQQISDMESKLDEESTSSEEREKIRLQIVNAKEIHKLQRKLQRTKNIDKRNQLTLQIKALRGDL